MKRIWIAAALTLLLCGCGGEETLETVSDDFSQVPVLGVPREISVRLPDNAVAPVLESDSEQVYLCEDYEIVIETRASGDLNGTMEALSGYGRDQLTVMHTQPDGVQRYDFVWVSAGEQGDRLGRAVILDDGCYHYCMSVLRDAENPQMTQIVWRDVFESFRLM